MYRKSKMNYGPKTAIIFFFTVAPHFEVTPQTGLFKSDQNETSTMKNLYIFRNSQMSNGPKTQLKMFTRFKKKDHLGKGSNNQNGNLRLHLPFGVRPPPPLNGTNFQTFFTPLFFFCNWILHIWNGFYTSKISLLSPLIIGSKSSHLLYIHNIKPKLSAKHVFTVREWF